MLLPNVNSDQYGFSAQPRTLKPRTKFREPPKISEDDLAGKGATNIMWDKRIIRGNTYGSGFTAVRDAGQQFKSTQGRGKMAGKGYENNLIQAVPGDVSTPRPADGHYHMEVQTDENIELLTDKPPEYEKDAQTDFYIDRPMNRLFVPRKIGEDKGTQIEEGDLFDFDYEVKPILQTLITKTLEQARMEVLEEEELRIMKEEQKKYDEIRYAELVEAQRLEAFERRQQEEIERRKKQYQLKNQQSVLSHKKLISRILAKEYFKSLKNNAFGLLEDYGFFRTDFDVEMNTSMVPWTFNGTVARTQSRNAIQSILTSLSDDLMANLAKIHLQSQENERLRKIKEEEDKIAAKEERKRLKKELEEKKKKEEERKRLEELQAAIGESINRGELKEKIFAQVFSDVDNFGRDNQSIFVFGGLFTEILLILAAIDEFKTETEGASMANVNFTEESVEKWILSIMKDLFKDGACEIGVSQDFLVQLALIDETLTIENFFSGKSKNEQVGALLKEHLKTLTTSFILNNLEALNISANTFETVLRGMVRALMSEESEGRRLKLVVAPQDAQPANITAYCTLMPQYNDLPKYDIAQSKQPKRNKKRKESKASSQKSKKDTIDPNDPNKMMEATISDQQEGEEQKVEEGDKKNLDDNEVMANADYDDKATLFSLSTDKGRVLANHKSASIVLKRESIVQIGKFFGEIEKNEMEVLRRAVKKGGEAEKLFIENAAKVPAFSYEQQ